MYLLQLVSAFNLPAVRLYSFSISKYLHFQVLQNNMGQTQSIWKRSMVFCKTIIYKHITQSLIDTLSQLHRMTMIITWCLTIISFAVIFIDLDGWTNPYPHEIFGIIGTIICFIQPIIAMFRPNVSSPKRKYFNLTHIFCGFVAYGLASM